jgi:hypothetical protein
MCPTVMQFIINQKRKSFKFIEKFVESNSKCCRKRYKLDDNVVCCKKEISSSGKK